MLTALTVAAALHLAPHSAPSVTEHGETRREREHEAKRDIVDTAIAAGSFETLATALKAADLVGALKGDGPFTVFAPTDDAFAALPQETLQALLRPENRATLSNILTYHVVSGSVSAQDAIAAGKAKALSKDALSFQIDGGRLRVNDAAVTANDVACANGVIHIIDSVLIPPGGINLQPPGRLLVGVTHEVPSEALADQLGIDRHGSLLLTGITRGSEAENAGLRRFDVLTSIDGKPATVAELKDAKKRVGFGGEIQLIVVRRGKTIHVPCKVGVEKH